MESDTPHEETTRRAQEAFEVAHRMPLRVWVMWYPNVSKDVDMHALAASLVSIIEQNLPKPPNNARSLGVEELRDTILRPFIAMVNIVYLSLPPSQWAAGILAPSLIITPPSLQSLDKSNLFENAADFPEVDDQARMRSLINMRLLSLVPDENQQALNTRILDLSMQREVLPLSTVPMHDEIISLILNFIPNPQKTEAEILLAAMHEDMLQLSLDTFADKWDFPNDDEQEQW